MAGYYGVPWQTDGLNNQQIGGSSAFQCAFKDRSQHTGSINSIDLYRKSDGAAGPSNYWNGTGGSWTIRCETDSSGLPSGSLVAAGATVTDGTSFGSGVSLCQRFTFTTPIVDVEGSLRHFVVINADGTPATNFVSLNCMDLNDLVPTPLQPTYLDADRANMQKIGAGAWALDRSRYPIFALNYADGSVYGVSTYDALSGSGQHSIGALNRVRLNFTPSQTLIVSAAHFRVYKVAGTSSGLVFALTDITGGGVVLNSTLIPVASVHLGNTGSGYGARYVDLPLPNVTLTSGRNYSLELSSAEATNFYVSFPERRGGSVFGANFKALDRFLDGYWEHTTDGGTNWLLQGATTEQQAQAYFDVADPLTRRVAAWGSRSSS